MGRPIDSFDDEKLLLTYKSSQNGYYMLDEPSQGETFLTGQSITQDTHQASIYDEHYNTGHGFDQSNVYGARNNL